MGKKKGGKKKGKPKALSAGEQARLAIGAAAAAADEQKAAEAARKAEAWLAYERALEECADTAAGRQISDEIRTLAKEREAAEDVLHFEKAADKTQEIEAQQAIRVMHLPPRPEKHNPTQVRATLLVLLLLSLPLLLQC